MTSSVFLFVWSEGAKIWTADELLEPARSLLGRFQLTIS
jgi:hypothetical protein